MREFELDRAPLLRLSLLRTAEDEHIFAFSHHHILFDGWSMPLLLDELLVLYMAERDGVSAELPVVVPFRNYVDWLARRDPTEWRDFFREALSGFSCATRLPLPFDDDLSEPGEILDDNYARKIRELDSSTSAALDSFARRDALTPATLFRAAWALLLARYSGEADVLFGSVMSGRPPDLPGAETMVGLFINTLPLRVRVPLDAPLRPWLVQLQELQFELLRHQHAPLAEISALTDLPPGQPLFETILVYENYPLGGQLFERMESLGMSELRAWDKTNYPLTLAVSPGAHPVLQFVYDRRRYIAPAIEKLLGHLANLHLPVWALMTWMVLLGTIVPFALVVAALRHVSATRAGIVAMLVGLLSATLPLGQSIGVFAVIAYGLLVVAALLLPETKGRELTPDG